MLFYDAKPYEKEAFDAVISKMTGDRPEIDYLASDINLHTVKLARGYDCVCLFVASDAGKEIIKALADCNVKLILMRCAGVNNIDIETAKKCKISVMRVPAYSPPAIAEHAIALAFAVNRKIHKAYIRVRENNFSLSGLTGVNFFGKTAGIIGTGKIGSAMAKICRGIGMNVVGYDMRPNPELDFVKYLELDELLKVCDLISLHCPLTEQRYNRINRSSLSK